MSRAAGKAELAQRRERRARERGTATSPPATTSIGSPRSAAAARTGSSPARICSGVVGKSSRTCGVAAMTAVPSAAAAARIASESSSEAAPSSSPGRTWEWRSITRTGRRWRSLPRLTRPTRARVHDVALARREARMARLERDFLGSPRAEAAEVVGGHDDGPADAVDEPPRRAARARRGRRAVGGRCGRRARRRSSGGRRCRRARLRPAGSALGHARGLLQRAASVPRPEPCRAEPSATIRPIACPGCTRCRSCRAATSTCGGAYGLWAIRRARDGGGR